uniref:NADH-ubiquinone oxidoreductase chain 6 n=1 Tax=Eophileurus chinensis TaxID=1247161 RepID=A0A8A3SR48_9SCAR|nr:NADH dehydrogenase subunit 6 [Eophileurus chinensis]QSZ78125.1 NADH dehydrogenase subunit 6 [Eophileurus chinensis]
MILTLVALMMISSICIVSLAHPMSMGGILLLQTITITLTIGFFHSNFWYSYVLFLVMVSGMLVLFAYMTSVASNEKFTPSFKVTFMVVMIIIAFVFIFMMMDPYYSNMNNIFSDSINLHNSYSTSMTKYFNYPTISIMIMLIIYLLITLIAVVKITMIKMGPLRQTN